MLASLTTTLLITLIVFQDKDKSTTAKIKLHILDNDPRKITPFQLIDQDKKIITQKDFLGKVYVVDFMFTSCKSICIPMSNAMQELQTQLKRHNLNNVRLLSISFDPKKDTPQVLKNYAQRHNANPDIWRFATGKQADIFRLSNIDFTLSLTQNKQPDSDDAFIHSGRFALIDKQGRLRGFYLVIEPTALDGQDPQAFLSDDQKKNLPTPQQQLAKEKQRLIAHLIKLNQE